MKYLKHPEPRGDILISLEDIRFVKAIRASTEGGAPYHDSGQIVYNDGFIQIVSMKCALAVQQAFKSNTVLPRSPKENPDG